MKFSVALNGSQDRRSVSFEGVSYELWFIEHTLGNIELLNCANDDSYYE